LSKTLLYQLTAIFLILLAGQLWTQRLGSTVFDQEKAKIHTDLEEQGQLLKNRLAEKSNPLELVSIGRKLLAAGNPEFAALALERATTVAPAYRDGWYLLGYSYLQLASSSHTPPEDQNSYLAQATKALQKAKAIDPGHKLTNDLLKQLGGN
jgi:tetratricopeptide (TPR) repeat protein